MLPPLMALSAPVLSAAMKAGLLANANAAAVDNAALTALCDEIAAAVVAHVTVAGVVTVPLGIAVQVVPATGTGATIAPAVGVIS